MLTAAEMVLDKGIVPLSLVFRTAFPDVTYGATPAKQRLLQMPLVVIRIGEPHRGNSQLYIMEYVHGMNYGNLAQFLETSGISHTARPKISKEEMKKVLAIAQSDRERECLRYAIYRASGLTPTATRRYFGFERMEDRAKCVEKCLHDAQVIRETVEDLSHTQERAVLRTLGVKDFDSSSDVDGDDADCTDESDSEVSLEMNVSSQFQVPDVPQLVQSRFNWFEIMESIDDGIGEEESEKCFSAVMKLDLSAKEKELLRQSYDAYSRDLLTRSLHQRKVDALNGLVVSDSDTDDPEQYIGLSLTSDRLREVVARRRRSIQRRARYLRAKLLAERNYLGRKRSKSVKGIVMQFPNIGKVIEAFVKERNVGADAWRRTGVLTFDGNCQVKEKVTFRKIQHHLQEVYHRKFAYGTVVQLCVARNRRRRSAMRYKGVAQVTCRRARKGFCMRYNPDKHWSSALYRGLNHLQLTDGRGHVVINRDDAAGFRLDTMATHRLQRTPCVGGKQALTTFTDYVSRYPSTLQVTSYNFTGTETTGELCAGMVKASGVFPKNPSQHAADLDFLKTSSAFQPAFVDPRTGQPKPVYCIRVDGASDEGPSHEEVQFLWTAQHLESGSYATLVSCRNSGSSYLNRVELQNGCLALGHANLFIPSTLGGSCVDGETGKIDQNKLRHNMDLAMDVYLNRVDGSPCGETTICLFKGADSSERQRVRPYLIQYLKGSKKQREALQAEQPSLYLYFEKVWMLRNNHMVEGLPTQYLFYLLCSNCKAPNCPHAICQGGRRGEVPAWYEGGPTISYLPLPIPDTSRPWGSSCSDCKGCCYGHFLKPVEALTSTHKPMSEPPSVILGTAFKKLKGKTASDSDVEKLARRTLLPPDEVRLWFSHLETVSDNRKRGAQKAAKTRRLRKAQQAHDEQQLASDACYCGVCHEQYVEYTDTVQKWIGCDACDRWYHFTCVGLTSEPDNFICEECS